MKRIEIPPPRPKRKPMHPYPRKLVSPLKTGISIPENSPTTSEMENQSPTSVLCSPGSDSSIGGFSCTPGGSPSLVPSALTLDEFGSEVPAENSSADEQEEHMVLA